MLRFFDSTALVKALVFEERGHEQAASLLGESAGHRLGYATAWIAVFETLSKVWRVTGNVAELAKLDRHLDKFSLYDIGPDYAEARKFIVRYRLKGADAAILAVATGVSRRERMLVEFVSADHDQLSAAKDIARKERIKALELPSGLK